MIPIVPCIYLLLQFISSLRPPDPQSNVVSLVTIFTLDPNAHAGIRGSVLAHLSASNVQLTMKIFIFRRYGGGISHLRAYWNFLAVPRVLLIFILVSRCKNCQNWFFKCESLPHPKLCPSLCAVYGTNSRMSVGPQDSLLRW